MKTRGRVLLAVLFCLLMCVNVWADAGRLQKVDYKTDYYMVVMSPDGGVDFYSEPDFDSAKLNDALIPNGVAFHIEGEKKTEDGQVWGYTTYRSMNGYVPLDDLKPVTRSEAVDYEFYAYGGKAQNYDITVTAEDGQVVLHHGPGIKYGEVSGQPKIKKGTALHITSDVDTGDGTLWGKTVLPEGYTGWIDIHQAVKDGGESLEMVESKSKVSNTKKEAHQSSSDQTESLEKQRATSAPKPTETPALTKAPTKTPTQTPTKSLTKAPEKTPTEKPLEAVTAAPTKAPTEKPLETVTAAPTEEQAKDPTVTPTREPSATPEPEESAVEDVSSEPEEGSVEEEGEKMPPEEIEVEDVSETPATTEIEDVPSESQEVQDTAADAEAYSWHKNPIIWILSGAILIALLIVFFLIRQNKEEEKEDKK